MIPNAARLEEATIGRIENRLRDPDFFLVVTGRTNLPGSPPGSGAGPGWSGPQGYTGWGWAAGLPLRRHFHLGGSLRHGGPRSGRSTGRGRRRRRGSQPASTRSPETSATPRRRPAAGLAPGSFSPATPSTPANQVFEFLGGVLQAHLYVGRDPQLEQSVHWGDTLVYFLARLLKEHNQGLPSLAAARVRQLPGRALPAARRWTSQPTWPCWEYEAANLVPASWDILDPVNRGRFRHRGAVPALGSRGRQVRVPGGWPAQRQPGGRSPPPTWWERGLYEHIRITEERLGIRVYTCGTPRRRPRPPRDPGPAMGLRVREGALHVGNLHLLLLRHVGIWRARLRDRRQLHRGQQRFLVSLPPGHHPGWRSTRPLRGWDRTHEYDCDYRLVDLIYSGRHGKAPFPGSGSLHAQASVGVRVACGGRG